MAGAPFCSVVTASRCRNTSWYSERLTPRSHRPEVQRRCTVRENVYKKP
jgi:hypothetical protein